MATPDHNSSSSRDISRAALVVIGVLALLGLAYAILRVDILRARIANLQTTSAALENSNIQLQAQLQELLRTQQSNDTQLSQLQTDLDSTHDQLGSLQNGVTPTQQQWAHIEAIQLLRMAQNQLQLGHDIGSATHSVAAALTALSNDSQTRAVQQRLTHHLQQLRALPLADYTRAQQQLQQAAQTIRQLPLRTQPLAAADPAQPLPDSGIARGWAQLRQALGSLIKVRDDATPVLSSAAALLGQVQLQSLLTHAALAVNAQDQPTYQATLAQAQTLIGITLDTQNAQVQILQKELQQLVQLNIAPDLPDLDDSLVALERGLPTSLSGQAMSKP
jgi:uncharacterized protein HemX